MITTITIIIIIIICIITIIVTCAASMMSSNLDESCVVGDTFVNELTNATAPPPMPPLPPTPDDKGEGAAWLFEFGSEVEVSDALLEAGLSEPVVEVTGWGGKMFCATKTYTVADQFKSWT
eukprot:COSAG05_NODE_817_length_7141_cov_4.933684_1_plen_121_part_00